MERNKKLKLQPSTQSPPHQKPNPTAILPEIAKKWHETLNSNRDFLWNQNSE